MSCILRTLSSTKAFFVGAFLLVLLSKIIFEEQKKFTHSKHASQCTNEANTFSNVSSVKKFKSFSDLFYRHTGFCLLLRVLQ